MANVKNNSAAQDTRRRLLRAAGEVFAERGFRGATIKDITDRAGASLASVNYHFKDKAELYAAVLSQIADDLSSVVPSEDTSWSSSPPAARLRTLVRQFCTSALGHYQSPWRRMLLTREWEEPTAALEPFYQKVIRPWTGRVSEAVAELLGAARDDERASLASGSILAQCVHFLNNQKQIVAANPRLAGDDYPRRVADHVTDFSLAGIRSMLRRGAGANRDGTRGRPKPGSLAVAGESH